MSAKRVVCRYNCGARSAHRRDDDHDVSRVACHETGLVSYWLAFQVDRTGSLHDNNDSD